MSRIRILPLALACAFALSPAFAAPATPTALPKGLTAGPCVEGICEYRMANGLRVLLFPDTSRPTVTVNITYGVGSANESYGETGMAHLLEHLMFKGTPTHTDIPAEMKKRGVSYNATTSLDRTNYFGSFPANDDTLAWMLGLEADRMVHSNIARKDLDSEMTVVRNEMERNDNNPGSALSERLRAAAYQWHNYGHTTIGARSDVENVPIERLQAFYRTWYRPDNATLVIAGPIDTAKALAQVVKAFGPVAKPAKAMPVFYTVEPVQDGEHEVTVRRRGDVRLEMLTYHVPGATHADSAALDVLLDVLGDTPTGRLHKTLVEGKLAAGVGAGSDGLRDAGLATFYVSAPKSADAAKIEAELLRLVEQDIAQHPITAEEVTQSKQRFANAFEKNLSDVNAVAMGLTGAVADGDWRLFFLDRDRVAAVTVDDVNRVAKAYLKPSNRTLGRFVPTDSPDRAEIPAAPDAATALKGFTGRAAVAAGEAFDPTPQNIQARTETFTVGDGLKVALLPKDTRGDTVVVNATFRFGDVESLKQSPDPAASIAGAMLMRGSKALTREQIAQRFEALNTRGGVGGGLQGANISLDSKRDTVAEALALAASLLREPAFDEAEFEQIRLQAITGMEANAKEPGPLAGDALATHFDPWPVGHPLHHDSLDAQLAQIKALKLDDVRRFHQRFYGTSQGEITVVGDFDAKAMRVQIESLFASWKSPVPYAPIDTRFTDVAPQRLQIETPDKSNAVVIARINTSLNEADADYPALAVANYILGGGSMASRLGERIRGKEGLSYGVGSSLSADSSATGRDDDGALTIQAIAAPQNAAKVETGIREEFTRLVRDGVTESELRDAVAGLLTQRKQSRASDGAVAGTLSHNLYLGRTMDYQAQFDAHLAALSVAEVNAALKRHFDPAKLSIYLAGDFAKAAAAK
ncbi:insulinase family protein [Lysobacter sp. TY2-98]|uniref:M16 family metallopeptidase n=1 Tax=Lysobacter sp. TY2-98 TaxID=2290922 RepID=UPI000E202F6C|nr:pitrilysin family protein [Lysobacter sp. TY2-98]AXK73350.1 insulinase family protein [Lysobacter sp. TY2-98]